MEQKREQAMVGVFVIIATGLLLTTIFAIGGAFGRAGSNYRAFFKNAGGLEPGSVVRYAGIRVGRVESLTIDPKDSTRIQVAFSVEPGVPIKTDSVAKIASLSALGENFLAITPGKPESTAAQNGATLPSKEFFGITDVADILNDLGPSATDLVDNLNNRAIELQTTLARVNDLLNDQNRAQISGSLNNLNGMLAENRPRIHSALGHVDESTAKLSSTIDQFKQTAKQADETLKKLDSTLGENREDLHKSIVQLHKTLEDASGLVDQLSRTMNTNSENLDETLENVRLATENLRAFTEEIKTRPYTLIRATAPPEHKPGKTSKP
jgi:phospholipid/cholesterol/gamma-HCH transport system substrate-binding protein